MAFEVIAKISCNRCNKNDNVPMNGGPPAGWNRIEIKPIAVGRMMPPATHFAELCPGCSKQMVDYCKMATAPTPPAVPAPQGGQG